MLGLLIMVSPSCLAFARVITDTAAPESGIASLRWNLIRTVMVRAVVDILPIKFQKGLLVCEGSI